MAYLFNVSFGVFKSKTPNTYVDEIEFKVIANDIYEAIEKGNNHFEKVVKVRLEKDKEREKEERKEQEIDTYDNDDEVDVNLYQLMGVRLEEEEIVL